MRSLLLPSASLLSFVLVGSFVSLAGAFVNPSKHNDLPNTLKPPLKRTTTLMDPIQNIVSRTQATFLPKNRGRSTHLFSLRVMTPSIRSKLRERFGNHPLRRFFMAKKWDPVDTYRALAVTVLSTLVLSHKFLDRSVFTPLWTYLTTSSALPARIFRTDSYEWCLAVTAFAVFIHAFGYADRAVRKQAEAVAAANNEGSQHPWRQYRLQDRYEADKHRRRYGLPRDEKVNEDKHTSTTAASSQHPPMMPAVQHSPWHWQAWIFEFWVYVLPLLAWDILSPRRYRRLGAFAAPTILRILRDVPLGLFLYDFFFFCGHFLMHKVPFLYKYLHKKHHTNDEVRACDQVRLTLGEEVIDVGCSIVALNLLGVHPVARSLYNIVIVFLLCELHSGFDFPWAPQNVVPFGIVTGSRRHHYHHRFGHHYYQKFFFTVDRIFGLFQKDDGSLKGDSVKRDAYVPASWKT